MANEKIYRLEDIKAWQFARKIRVEIYAVTKKFPSSEEYIHKKHMRECARNIPGNVAEGFGRFHYLECIHFYRIARGSANELKSDLYGCLDLGFILKDEFDRLSGMLEEEVLLINGLIRSASKAKALQSPIL